MDSPTSYHILNLGAGVQSTALYLMFCRGDIEPTIDYAIFADTGEEPQAVYAHLEWLSVKRNREDWERAVYIDRQLRVPGNIVNRNMDKQLFVHRSCKPLDEVEFNTKPDPRAAQMALSFWAECEGVCGV